MISAKDARNRATIFYKMLNNAARDAQLLRVEAEIITAIKEGRTDCAIAGKLIGSVVRELEESGYGVKYVSKAETKLDTQKTQSSMYALMYGSSLFGTESPDKTIITWAEGELSLNKD